MCCIWRQKPRASYSIKGAAVRGRAQQRGHCAQLRRRVDGIHRCLVAVRWRILELIPAARAASAHRGDELLHLCPLELRRVRGVLRLVERRTHRRARRACVAALDPPSLDERREEVAELRNAEWEQRPAWKRKTGEE